MLREGGGRVGRDVCRLEGMGDCEAGERMLVGDGDEVGRHVLVDSVVKVDA